jgi:hypothetical protein
VRAQEALEELRQQHLPHLPHGDTLVKREMSQALHLLAVLVQSTNTDAEGVTKVQILT